MPHWINMMHLSLKSFAVIFSVSFSVAECRLQVCSTKRFRGCRLQPFLTCPWLSHGTNISRNWAKVATGRGIYWWVMYLHGDVFVQYENIFCKKTKNRDCSSVWLLYRCISNAMCYYTRRSSLLLDWCYTQREEYAVLCGVLYSIHNTLHP